jgi:hypothetical protein
MNYLLAKGVRYGDGRNFNQAYKRNRRDQHLMVREKYKLKSEAESIEANVGVGLCHISDEDSVMELERRT